MIHTLWYIVYRLLSLLVPVTSVWEKDLASTGVCHDDNGGVEPLNMELKGKKRKLTAAYDVWS